jgi:sporulation protein YlmC with PRC-barrel domain
MIHLLLVGAIAACGADDDNNGSDANDNDTVTVPTLSGEDEVLPTEVMDEPTATPMLEETEETVEEPTLAPTEEEEIEEPTVEATAEIEPTAESSEEITATEESTAPLDEVSTFRASDIIGMELWNSAEEQIAEIQEVLFDENGDIQYVILSSDKMSDEFPYYAVAWDTFALPLSEEQTNPDVFLYDDDTVDIEGALGLEEAMLETDDLFYQTAEDAGTDTQMLDGLYQLSSFADFSLFDYDLLSQDDEDDLGEIEELLVNLDENKVTYAVADIGGWLGIAETAVAIPWERISFDETEEEFTINATQEELTDAPSIDMSEFDEWEVDDDWEQTIEDYWSDLTGG